jgi:hypothetical protein
MGTKEPFGLAKIKSEGESIQYDSEAIGPETIDNSTWMELCVDLTKQTREEIHELVDGWIDEEITEMLKYTKLKPKGGEAP